MSHGHAVYECHPLMDALRRINVKLMVKERIIISGGPAVGLASHRSAKSRLTVCLAANPC
jgi:hypothetical protein